MIGLAERHGAGRLEPACALAIDVGDPSASRVSSIPESFRVFGQAFRCPCPGLRESGVDIQCR